MKIHSISYFTIILLAFSLSACCGLKPTKSSLSDYKPDDPKLHNTILSLDSAFFDAYNHCDRDLKKYGEFYSDSLEFFHDLGGLLTSKEGVIEGTQKNICGKVTRELVKGSVEVYGIKDYGALEMGFHIFHNNVEKSTSKPGKFIIMWKKTGGSWKITKVVSLH